MATTEIPADRNDAEKTGASTSFDSTHLPIRKEERNLIQQSSITLRNTLKDTYGGRGTWGQHNSVELILKTFLKLEDDDLREYLSPHEARMAISLKRIMQSTDTERPKPEITECPACGAELEEGERYNHIMNCPEA